MSAHSEESALKDKELKAEHADDAPPTYAKDEYTAFQGLPPDPDAGCSEEEKAAIDKRLLRKLDWKLIPWLSLLYLMSFLDRTNIGNAKIAGLTSKPPAGIGLSGPEYNISLTVFFISYALFEPLTNVLLKRLKPSIFLPMIMFFWGLCMTCMGLVTNYSGLVAVRFFLGLCEAGLFPGVNYYLSCWYKRSEFGIRAAIFFSAAALAGSFGGLLAYALEKMDGLGSKPGWAWIFIIEGLATIVISVASIWMVHDFPDDAKFLSEADRIRVIRRLKMDKQSSAEHEDFKMDYFWSTCKDYKTWMYSLIYMGADMPLYAFSLFLPTIISSLGTFSTVQAQLLTIPPYACAAAMTIFVGWMADRTKQRGIWNIGVSVLGIVGFIMLLSGNSAGVRYAGVYLGAMGIYPCISNTISWGSNNFEGVYRRGVAIGIFIGWGNLNGVVSSNIYIATDAPAYRIGHGIVLAYLVLFLFGGSTVQTLILRAENKKRLAGRRDYWTEGKSHEEIELLGDRRPDFIYTV
ncbi:MAG: hypothetical protein GOMPHAMPRED_002810 [Gomphillus americanus]|uniref:Major facilitator superfamily (MFS) profile domain-containing protein n=1 Tax=Gomphillus americanus TaxID=1940652 RepID=A0A8H3FLR7_9LECA|nr:MAG: hypothetical protein GOMPHAMPRED_002810 [Gomphillus americanus]